MQFMKTNAASQIQIQTKNVSRFQENIFQEIFLLEIWIKGRGMSMSIIIEAAQYAAKAHEGVFRKHRKVPYINHPSRVAGRVAIHPKATPELVAVAWLHDVIEDVKDIGPDDIRKTFGNEVAEGCIALCNPSIGSKESRKVRKAQDRAHIAELPDKWKLIKIIDRIDNLTDLHIDRGLAEISFLELYAKESRLLLDEAFEFDDKYSYSATGFGETISVNLRPELLVLIQNLEDYCQK
jgi:(p)ppGpp synthase/HD superfamily hydrolase